ncbi:MAG: hypothetical protein NTZ63_07000 [Candidatus Omnitrophica bacterium]|nr:hypothetical protein [Candidatus Omnitrophota bacterium]
MLDAAAPFMAPAVSTSQYQGSGEPFHPGSLTMAGSYDFRSVSDAPFNPEFKLDTGYQAPTDFGIGSNTTLPIAQFTTQNDGSIGIKDVNVRVGDTYAANQPDF